MFRKRNIFNLFKFEAPNENGGDNSFMSDPPPNDPPPNDPPAGDPPAGDPPPNDPPAGTTFVDSQGNFSTGWRDQLPEDIRSAASLKSIKDLKGLAAAYVSTKSMVGANTIKLPGENSSAEDWAAFHKQTGRPETAEEYVIERNKDLPEEYTKDDKFMNAFKPLFHQAGLNPGQVKILTEGYDNQMLDIIKDQAANAVDPVEARNTALKTEWGDDFKLNMGKADMAATQLDPTGEIFNGPASSDPAFIRAMAKVADLLGGDTMVNGDSNPSGLDSIESELSSIRGSDAYQNENHADHDRTIAKHNLLARKRAALRK
jgi:hypothetical protein